MKTTKEQADLMIQTAKEYIGKVYSNEIEYDVLKIDEKDLIHTSILSVKHTIEVLRDLKSQMEYTEHIKPLINKIKQQTELLTELESRL